MKRSIAHIPDAEQTRAIKDKAFMDIMGRDGHGRVRTYGSGATPTDVLGASSLSTTGSTPSERIQQMIETAVQTRMMEYEARREKDIEAMISARMTEYNKRRDEDIAASVKHYLEVFGIHIPSQIPLPHSSRMRSSVGQVTLYFSTF